MPFAIVYLVRGNPAYDTKGNKIMRADQIGINIAEYLNSVGIKINREHLAEYLDNVRGGQFIRVNGYINKKGETEDLTLRFGIRYGNLKDRDIKFVQSCLNGERALTINVKHCVWVPTALLATIGNAATSSNAVHATLTFQRKLAGVMANITVQTAIDLFDTTTFTNRKASDRTAVELSYAMPSTHPAAIQALQSLLDGFLNPEPATAEYVKEGKSLYSLDSTKRWYLRDVLVVDKRVTNPVAYQFKASAIATAVKDAIRRNLLTSKYRQIILTDGQFDSVVTAGQAILCDGMTEEFYMALPETLKQVHAVEAA